jgi:hypothetical protein
MFHVKHLRGRLRGRISSVLGEILRPEKAKYFILARWNLMQAVGRLLKAGWRTS